MVTMWERLSARRRATANTGHRKIRPDSRLAGLLIEKIQTEKWSPEQVAGWLRYFFPKKADFASLTQTELDQVVA